MGLGWENNIKMALGSKMWGCGLESTASAWRPMVGFGFLTNCETERLSASPRVRWGQYVALRLQHCHNTERRSLNAVPVLNDTSWHECCMGEWRYGSNVHKCKCSSEMYSNAQYTTWSLDLIWIYVIERGVKNRTYIAYCPIYFIAYIWSISVSNFTRLARMVN
jgi:hypothetical protein